ncbi:FAD-dependent oxidoreductase [Jeotgalibacillus sp. ET6]|uniref:FAD-dependent oxidoreductase n=1 Tax=Jeotgalibacillus sp. ET6 TaxID=3037260 RepID=UPI0024189CFA|nr:FAD-dependent oxidoreductase [Jeotgalibacillus sp. ET6]MDG5472842.1 FAD-dependent oxidoreductase [Jeotgalibacillus sp. ET6]
MKTIILAGGGHTHLSILKQLTKSNNNDIKWILVSSDDYQYYSGMFSGYIEGLYSLEDIRIHLPSLAAKANCEFYQGSVDTIDPFQKIISVNGQSFSYDYLSLDIGSHTTNPAIPGLKNELTRLKPAHTFPDHINELHVSRQTAVIGGGAAACEMALSLAAWKRKHQRRYDQISLIYSGTLLQKHGRKAQQIMHRLMKENSIKLYEDERAKKIVSKKVVTANRTVIPFDQLLYLGGAYPPELLKESGLPVDEKGFLEVNGMLQSPDFPSIFGAGDCITLSTHPEMEKNGVHAVKQGEVLWHNLNAVATKEPLMDYQPQKNSLAILSTGYKKGLLLRGKTSLYGSLPWQLKNYIDRKFMKEYQ